ncbi:UDP-N-acetylmuramyl pentapeptide phosphotransferase/UDP-N-acetylglucosamine-1-phosphate transferase [Allocatelliglobosispora scoriae]|uniref:UDP-N-acetylmuramyl pentapeptide phosphotransferase/UDP-N-acetylglucosamine-1-phosphate transferase n=1 Tax=Allocatelliglobosispora scoriae TaxID=643052 RepID=A0A841BVU2_9ACTN|nr:hypothetical protein [Allocatelliglobosispora scoriae]MBB5873217.1 UDP-N-acetylmuramyl pentapeptide phosphotransferase/UDP-N-acetylglucosamine-1-phosphate transferase [Allocatelliglobosispora scoriae]
MSLFRKVVVAGAGAGLAVGALRWLQASPRAKDLERTNFRGRTVTLAGGPAYAVSAAVSSAIGAPDTSSAVAALSVGLSAGAVGLYDDIVGNDPGQRVKGFAGHLGALREGKVTSGLIKVAGIGAAGLLASSLITKGGRGGLRTAASVLVGAGVIAGSANLANLLDLRPGRAIKAGLIVGTPLVVGEHGGMAAGPLGAAAGLVRFDLGEEIMLGDSGANALGALLGTAYVARTGLLGRLVALAGLGALTAASERVSFTKVIEATPGLRELDALGRRSA